MHLVVDLFWEANFQRNYSIWVQDCSKMYPKSMKFGPGTPYVFDPCFSSIFGMIFAPLLSFPVFRCFRNKAKSYGVYSVCCMSTLCCNVSPLHFVSQKTVCFSLIVATFFHRTSMKKWSQEPNHKKIDV